MPSSYTRYPDSEDDFLQHGEPDEGEVYSTPPQPPPGDLEQTRSLIAELESQRRDAHTVLMSRELDDDIRERWANTLKGIDILLDHADRQLKRLEQQETDEDK